MAAALLVPLAAVGARSRHRCLCCSRCRVGRAKHLQPEDGCGLALAAGVPTAKADVVGMCREMNISTLFITVSILHRCAANLEHRASWHRLARPALQERSPVVAATCCCRRQTQWSKARAVRAIALAWCAGVQQSLCSSQTYNNGNNACVSHKCRDGRDV